MTVSAQHTATSDSIAIVAALSVVAAVLALAAFAFSTTLDLRRDRAEVAALETRLADFAARRPAVNGIDALASPLLDGATLTLAGAALQQRVEQAVARNGGALSSSEVDLDRPEAKDGVLALTASLEIPQPSLQALLYDLEAGSPLVFVDSLSVQAPQALGENEGGRMRVTLVVSGRWEAVR